MKKIVINTLAKLNKNSTLDEIKTVLKSECEKVHFEITNKDWNDMFDDIIVALA